MTKRGPVPTSHFDGAYFDRHYENPKTRVHGAVEVAHLIRGITSMAAYWGIPIQSVLDVGAGPGHARAALKKELPHATYRSIDVSPTACERYGHELLDVTQLDPNERYDLVLCQGVLQYLDNAKATKALKVLGETCGILMYFEALTKGDVDEVADLSRTDTDCFVRTGDWYRSRLKPNFLTLGCGLYFQRRAGPVFFELERGED